MLFRSLADDEHTLPTPHEKLRIAIARTADIIWVKKLLKWIEAMQSADEQIIKEELKMWVEEYKVDTSTMKNNRLAPEAITTH